MTVNARIDEQARPAVRALNKVPEVTIWFWVIKVLCTTVGESFADWINMTLGVGLELTSLLFTVVLVGVLVWQMRLRRYVPFAYWSCVVVLSVTGTLYTDILTDDLHVPLALSTAVFSALLAAVFGVWYARERTLSIHSITTLPRESFYWLAILVTFALGTAAGDWTLELTGWGPGISVLLPTALIAAVVVGWRIGANAVLSFWLAYILTRPLGANLGDWLASKPADGGAGLGTAGTSVLFLLAILATVVYLTLSRRDATESRTAPVEAERRDPGRERMMVAYFAAVAVLTAVVLVQANGQPHGSQGAEEEGPAKAAAAAGGPGPAVAAAQPAARFPAAEVDRLRTVTRDVLARVQAGDQAGAKKRAKDLETAWDADQPTLQPRDPAGWKTLDSAIDAVLQAVRAKAPDPRLEGAALDQLLQLLA